MFKKDFLTFWDAKARNFDVFVQIQLKIVTEWGITVKAEEGFMVKTEQED